MQFDSLIFAQFLLVVYLLHLAVARRVQPREWLLLGASCIFYMAWDARFIVLILGSCLLDFAAGLLISRAPTPGARRRWLVVSLAGNLGLLFLFKYLDFAVENLNRLGALWPGFAPLLAPHWILPVGISFYTFQSMSYTMDVYRGGLRPVSSLRRFLLFVTFFPQLVAGPIVKAHEFLPQLELRYRFDAERFGRGLGFILGGLIKKIVVADGLALLVVDRCFTEPGTVGSLEMLLAIYGYALQIYCDFSGYSDIAIGTALLFGFDMPHNFDSPYHAVNPQDFWRRWHISLSSWLRDYLYLPLGGSRLGRRRTMINLMIVMLLGGIWHGASWNFVIWGGLHGAALVAYHTWKDRGLGRLPVWLQRLIFFHFVALAWIPFRCPDPATTCGVLKTLVALRPGVGLSLAGILALLALGGLLHACGIEAQKRMAARFAITPVVVQALCVLLVLLAATYMSEHFQTHKAFIYFQF